MSTSNLLRKTKLLARRLHSKELENWINSELNGYGDEDDVPDYRIISRGMIYGDFSGAFGAGIRNTPIPLMNIFAAMPLDWKKWTEPIKWKVSISECESILKSNPGGNGMLKSPWPADIYNKLDFKVYDNMTCVQAWAFIRESKIEGIIDTVKTRILNFAMDIEEENPDAGEAGLKDEPVPQQVVTNAFNNTFNAPVGNVASGGSNFTQTATMTPIDKQLNINVDMAQFAEELKFLRAKIAPKATESDHYR